MKLPYNHFCYILIFLFSTIFIGCLVNTAPYSDSSSVIDTGKIYSDSSLQGLRSTYSKSRNIYFLNGNKIVVCKTETPELTCDQSFITDKGKIDSVFFLSDNEGWLAGSLDNVGFIWKTTDGGNSWEKISEFSPQKDLWSYGIGHQLYFSDQNKGWLLESFTIWKTEDGGKSWNQTYIVTDSSELWQPRSIQFSDFKNGWILGAKVLLKTNDGGNIWEKSVLPDEFDKVYFSDAKNGWGFSVSSNKLFKSGDGGITWTLFQKQENAYLKDVIILDENNGWLIGTELFVKKNDSETFFKLLVLKTTNGGKTWSKLKSFQSEEREFQDIKLFKTIIFDQFKVAIITETTVYLTKDSGKTFSTFEYNTVVEPNVY